MKNNYLLLATLLSIGLGIAATPNPKPEKAGDQKLKAKVFRVACLDCGERGDIKYRLKPINVTRTGSRSVPNGFIHIITLEFKCPVRHEFEVLDHEVFVPAIRAEEEK